MRAEIRAGGEFSLGPAAPWIRLPGDQLGFDRRHDDQQLLFVLPAEKPGPQTITVLQNWTSAIRKP